MSRADLLSNLRGLAQTPTSVEDATVARAIAADHLLAYLNDAEVSQAYRRIPCSPS